MAAGLPAGNLFLESIMKDREKYEHLRAAYELLDECTWYAEAARNEAIHAEEPATIAILTSLLTKVGNAQHDIHHRLTMDSEPLVGPTAMIDPPNRPTPPAAPSEN